VKSVEFGEGRLAFRFHDRTSVSPERVVSFLGRQGFASLSPTGVLKVPAPPAAPGRIEAARLVLRRRWHRDSPLFLTVPEPGRILRGLLRSETLKVDEAGRSGEPTEARGAYASRERGGGAALHGAIVRSTPVGSSCGGSRTTTTWNRSVAVAANRAAEHLTGVPADEVIGRPMREIFPNLPDTPLPAAYRPHHRRGGQRGPGRDPVRRRARRQELVHRQGIPAAQRRRGRGLRERDAARHADEEALRLNEERLRSLLANLPNVAWTLRYRRTLHVHQPEHRADLRIHGGGAARGDRRSGSTASIRTTRSECATALPLLFMEHRRFDVAVPDAAPGRILALVPRSGSGDVRAGRPVVRGRRLLRRHAAQGRR
jgi:PAS domain-containing protein